MRSSKGRTLARTSLAVAAASGMALAGLAAANPATAATGSHVSWRRSCALPTHAGQMACDALQVTGLHNTIAARGVHRHATPSGYGPSDLHSAYNLPTTGGSGQTVAIVDAYNDPHAASDLATYRAQYGLPACTTSNGCFKQVNENGSTSNLPSNDSGWAEEESLDIDMVSAICPECHILLVEADSASNDDLGQAVNEAVSLGANFVSNSYGGDESYYDSYYDEEYYDHPGTVITASAGDSGYGVEYPAASPDVVAVGGTRLSTSSNARGWSESVWSTSSSEGTGSGCSQYSGKPSWQTDTGCSGRTVGDVSAVADPATGVAVYDSYGASGWMVFGGTSVASPIIAATYALAGTPNTDYPAEDLYQHSSDLNDVTSGSTANCSPAYLCTAEPGYDGPTGLGTPNGLGAF